MDKIIVDENIYLEKVNKSHIDNLYKWWNDGEVMAHAGFPNGLGTSKEKILHGMNSYDEKTPRYIIFYKDIPVGECNYFLHDRAIEYAGRMYEENGTIGNYGIKICEKEYQEKGVGTKVLGTLIDILFDKEKCIAVYVDVSTENPRAQHVYENKLGFKKIDTIYDGYTSPQGIVISFDILKKVKTGLN